MGITGEWFKNQELYLTPESPNKFYVFFKFRYFNNFTTIELLGNFKT